MAKCVEERPEWPDAPQVEDIYSVSACISADFALYIPYWRHNGYWLFDSPEIIQALAAEHKIALNHCTLFYYEVYERQFDPKSGTWSSFAPDPAFLLNVQVPSAPVLEGYDVLSFAGGTSPECSPLSCNGLATRIPTNRHCLLASLDEAKQHLVKGSFTGSEPGPYRIFAVHTAAWP